MEIIFEILLDLVLELVTGFGSDVMENSEYTRKWPKPLRIFLAVVTLLFFLAVIIGLIVIGIKCIIDGNLAVGVFTSGIGVLLATLMIVKCRKEYKKIRR